MYPRLKLTLFNIQKTNMLLIEEFKAGLIKQRINFEFQILQIYYVFNNTHILKRR